MAGLDLGVGDDLLEELLGVGDATASCELLEGAGVVSDVVVSDSLALVVKTQVLEALLGGLGMHDDHIWSCSGHGTADGTA